jgi:hypothetical protein
MDGSRRPNSTACMRTPSVLPMGNHRQTLAVARALGVIGWRVVVAEHDSRPLSYASHSRRIDAVWNCPDPTTAPGAWLAALDDLLESRPHIHFLLPLGERDMITVDQFREQVEPRVRCVMVASDVMRVGLTKTAALRLAAARIGANHAGNELFGMHLPQWWIEHLAGQEPSIPADWSYPSGVRYWWFQRDVDGWLRCLEDPEVDRRERFRLLIRLPRSLLGGGHLTWDWADPVPSLYIYRTVAKRLVTRLLLRRATASRLSAVSSIPPSIFLLLPTPVRGRLAVQRRHPRKSRRTRGSTALRATSRSRFFRRRSRPGVAPTKNRRSARSYR